MIETSFKNSQNQKFKPYSNREYDFIRVCSSIGDNMVHRVILRRMAMHIQYLSGLKLMFRRKPTLNLLNIHIYFYNLMFRLKPQFLHSPIKGPWVLTQTNIVWYLEIYLQELGSI